jgi:2'-5' RNA ligase
MRAYLLVLEVTPLTVDRVYDMLPLHCTLVHWFWLNQKPDTVAQRLTGKLSGTTSVALKVGTEQVFTGKNKNGETIPVTVNDIELTPELRKLHEQTCAILEGIGGRYSEPQYVHDGFHPHITHQRDGALKPGEVCQSSKLYLIEADAPEYGNKRTVRASIQLVQTK